MIETVFESAPQFFLQSYLIGEELIGLAALHTHDNNTDIQQQRCDLDIYHYWSLSSIHFLQYFSCVSSSISAVVSMIKWISSARRDAFIDGNFHPWASLMPIAFWMVLSITQCCLSLTGPYIAPWVLYPIFPRYISEVPVLISVPTLMLDLILLAVYCRRPWWHLTRTLAFVVFNGAAIT